MFFRGQKVVCISDDWGFHCPACMALHVLTYGLPPEKGKTYVIADMREDEDGAVFLMLEGFRPGVAFHSEHFRPLVEKQTDISVFKEILEPSGTKVLEDVK